MSRLPKISEAEWEVMKTLWQRHPLTSEEIIEELSDKMKWSSQTIKTFITRLSKKEAISYDKKGRIYYYYPLISEKECKKSENKSFLERVYDGAVGILISNFLQDKNLTVEEIDEIEKMLKNKKEELNSKGR